MISRRNFLKGLLGTALAGLAFLGYAGLVEPGWRLRVQRWQISPRNWARNQKLRIVMLADIHAGVPHMSEARVQQICDRAMREAADLIVLIGDYRASHRFQSREIPVESIAPTLGQLRAPLGVYAILGNHDWWDDPVAQKRKGPGPVHSTAVLEAAGIPVLVNRAVRIAGAGGFWLAGLDSQRAFRRKTSQSRSGFDDLPGTLAQVSDDAPVVLLAHEPDIFAKGNARVALQLSGHTHGGQIRFGPWAPVVPSRFGSRFAYGHVIEEDRHLVVSGGLGCSGIPIRFGVPPEITVVDLS